MGLEAFEREAGRNGWTGWRYQHQMASYTYTHELIYDPKLGEYVPKPKTPAMPEEKARYLTQCKIVSIHSWLE